MEKPRIIICRHAESIEDVDNSVYDIMDDLHIPLTEKGIKQAESLGDILVQLLNNRLRIRFYTSPGIRNIQTLEIVLPKLSRSIDVHVQVDPLIVKQNWGKITAENRPKIEADRYRTGVLRYTFPYGESAANMIKRLSEFTQKIFRIQEGEGHDIVVLSHGFEFRVLLMVILGWDEELFESFGNVNNCEYRILTREASGKYVLNEPLRKHGRPITRLTKA